MSLDRVALVAMLVYAALSFLLSPEFPFATVDMYAHVGRRYSGASPMMLANGEEVSVSALTDFSTLTAADIDRHATTHTHMLNACAPRVGRSRCRTISSGLAMVVSILFSPPRRVRTATCPQSSIKSGHRDTESAATISTDFSSPLPIWTACSPRLSPCSARTI